MSKVSNESLTRLLRYVGGKRRLAVWVIRHFPEHTQYVEAFGGGASVLLIKPPSAKEVYNELDSDIVNMFTMIRDRGEELAEAIRLTPYSRDEFTLAFQPCTDKLEQARRTIIRSQMNYGEAGLRPGSHGYFGWNQPGAVSIWLACPENVLRIQERFKDVVIDNDDAINVCKRRDGRETLFYCDPPYAAEYQLAYKYQMSDDQHIKLSQTLHKLVGMVVISGYPSPLYDDLYADWERVVRNTYADCGRNEIKTVAQPRTEVLWINPRARQRIQLPKGFTK